MYALNCTLAQYFSASQDILSRLYWTLQRRRLSKPIQKDGSGSIFWTLRTFILCEHPILNRLKNNKKKAWNTRWKLPWRHRPCQFPSDNNLLEAKTRPLRVTSSVGKSHCVTFVSRGPFVKVLVALSICALYLKSKIYSSKAEYVLNRIYCK